MKNREKLIKQINDRRAELEKISRNLKNKFVGIDAIIDSVIENINIWYVIPELITRPVIINLWGMTGVGKTDLVRTLVYEMGFTDRFVEIQMRNKAKGYWNSTIQDFLNNSSIDMESPGVLLLDEIQRYRTVDQSGVEIHDHDFQDLWMLLSDGVFSNDSGAKETLMRMMFGDAYWEDQRTSGKDEDEEEEPKDSKKKKKDKKKEAEKKQKKRKRNFHRDYYSATTLKKRLKRKETVEQIMKWTEAEKTQILTAALQDKDLYQGDNYGKLLIFISGNLDEVYKMATDTADAEIDADIFHAFSKKITMVSVKSALKKRFKPEQISRFGNTHIIYPSLSKKSYQEIIRKKLEEITNDIYEKHGVRIVIDKSVNDFVYRNGVFPAQGVRPVLSTISSAIMNSFPLFLLSAIEAGQDKIEIEYKNKFLESKIGTKTEKYYIEGELDRIKKIPSSEQRIVTSVHEAGHSVTYADLFRVVPTQIVANSSSDDIPGYIGLHSMVPSKSVFEKKMAVLMAGMAAEEIIFGEDSKTSGSQGDLLMATQIASQYIRQYGMDSYSSFIKSPHTSNQDTYNFNIDESNGKIEEILVCQKKKAIKLLNRNKDFLIEVVDILRGKGTIKSKEFKGIAKKHNVDVEIVKAKDYLCTGYIDKFEEFKQ